MAAKSKVKNSKSKTSKVTTTKLPRDKLLPKLTTFFFDRFKTTGLIWLVLVVFGAVSYTTLLRREGFPSVNIPFSVVSGTYFANDPAKVDSQVAKPISDIVSRDPLVKAVQTQSSDNFFSASIQFKEGTDAKVATDKLKSDIDKSGLLPKAARVQYNVPYFGATGGDIEQIDVAISFFSKDGKASTVELTNKAQAAAKYLNDLKLSNVKSVFVKNPLDKVSNPVTGKSVTVERSFDRYGIREGTKTDYFNSVIIGVAAAKDVDVIKLDKQVREALVGLEANPQFSKYQAKVSASFAPNIKDNLSELQRVLLEGLVAVLVVGSIVIAMRASLITVVSMVTVLLSTLGFLYAIGYTLNVITLFALILGLALIVDDTIIMVEAIDAARRHEKDPRQAVKDATRKVSRAMVAATATASLSFMPLIFVGGILGSFIRAIPITIIASLIISLFVALLFIPFFARFVLLGKKQMGKSGVKEIAAGFEAKLASFIARPMLWARNSKKKLFGVGLTAMLIGFGFIFAGATISKNVVFNIFPPTKDTNGIALTINFPHGTTIVQAKSLAEQIDKQAADVLGDNFDQSSYYNQGSAQTALEQIQIISYNKRKVTSPQLVKQLQDHFDGNFKGAQVAVDQIDLGPPSAAFTIDIDASNRPAAFKVAHDLANYLSTAKLKRISGKEAHFTKINVTSPDQYIRSKGKPIITVTTGFDGNDTTTLVTLAQNAVKDQFNEAKLKTYGVGKDTITFDLGQEQENQDSFKTLALAFPILLVVMFVLLAIQFGSLLQPLLIFMAIPFSFFGIMLGLDITHNAISFFAMLGFFALIGLSIKNTILLTDFANQARRSGMHPIDAAHAALEERFRPLFATSMTAVVSLIPLAISSPFWQGLSVVLIFGLLSSTFLVVTVFPYYYLGAEYLRQKIRARDFFAWLVPTALVTVAVCVIAKSPIGLLVVPLSILFVIFKSFYQKRLAK